MQSVLHWMGSFSLAWKWCLSQAVMPNIIKRMVTNIGFVLNDVCWI